MSFLDDVVARKRTEIRRAQQQTPASALEQQAAFEPVRGFRAALAGPGAIIDSTGKKLGEHAGVHHYTIGQRKGLGVATGEPVYVTAIDPKANTLTVGARHMAMRSACRAQRVNWISEDPVSQDFRAHVQIRYMHEPAAAQIRSGDEGDWIIDFDEPQFAVTPGQLAVFYRRNEVLGAGWIT